MANRSPRDVLSAALDADRDAGVDLACEQLDELRGSGSFDGVHLIPITRYRQLADRLDPR